MLLLFNIYFQYGCAKLILGCYSQCIIIQEEEHLKMCFPSDNFLCDGTCYSSLLETLSLVHAYALSYVGCMQSTYFLVHYFSDVTNCVDNSVPKCRQI